MSDTTVVSATKLPAKVLKCTCPHEYQDKKYGPSFRVHNPASHNGKAVYRCTVCGTEK